MSPKRMWSHCTNSGERRQEEGEKWEGGGRWKEEDGRSVSKGWAKTII